VKLFPSTTDTWGNAPLEAQSAGLPVIVSDKGGPHELMVDGITGFKISGRDTGALCDAMRKLMDPAVRERMGRDARTFVEQNRIDEPFSAILDSEGYRQRIKRQKKQFALVHEPDAPEAQDSVDDYLIDHRVLPASAAGA
jgi:glycosyltransferase involved in cell wall biosynthesis